VRNILNEFSENPDRPFTVDRIDSLTRILSNEAFKAQRSGDGNAGMAVRAVREALDNVQPNLPPSGGSQLVTLQQAANLRQGDQAAEALRLFDTARGFARNRRVWQESAPFIQDALGDVAPDKFARKHIIDGTVENLAQMRQTFANEPPVIDSIKQRMIDFVLDRGGVEGDYTKMSSAGMRKAFDQIGQRKWELFFDPQEIQQIRAAINVGRSIQIQPAGSAVNNSGTAGAMTAQLLSMMRGVPVVGNNIAQPLLGASMRMELGRMQNLTPGLLGGKPAPLALPNPLTAGLLAAPALQPGQE
jgi:hypothetical protein